jgi:DNA-binding SARP family transcriptional activator
MQHEAFADRGAVTACGVGGADRAATMRVEMLGALRVRRADGSTVHAHAFKTVKTRHLLRLLALHAGRPVRSSWLVESLWPDVPDARGRASLRTAVCELRRSLGAAHVARRGDQLVLCDAEVDVVEFERHAGRSLRAVAARDAGLAVSLARQATALYRGGLAEDDPVFRELAAPRAELERLHGELLLQAAAASLHLRRPSEAIGFAHRIFTADPCSERAARALMEAYHRLGELAGALRVYDRCRRAMAEELGVSPSAETRKAYERLLASDLDGSLTA